MTLNIDLLAFKVSLYDNALVSSIESSFVLGKGLIVVELRALRAAFSPVFISGRNCTRSNRPESRIKPHWNRRIVMSHRASVVTTEAELDSTYGTGYSMVVVT
ncbi:MAG: hypothetical protein RIK87_15545 [Fuerstiella sp.]